MRICLEAQAKRQSVVVEPPLVFKPVRSTVSLSEDVINDTLPEFLHDDVYTTVMGRI